MADLHEEMTLILRRLASALIEIIPETWTEATLRAEVQRSEEGTSISHSIESEQHPHDVVVGRDDLFRATRELQLLCDEAGQPWSGLIVRAQQVDEQWRFTTKFEYPD
jgi:hypothetical protein